MEPELAGVPSTLCGCKCGLICTKVILQRLLCDVDLIERCTVKAVSCDVDLIEECIKAVSCDVLLTSDSLADLEQCESIWNHMGVLLMPQKSPP